MKHYIIAIFALFALCACSSHNKYADLQKALDEYVEGKDATIGVAVIIDGVDTVEVNGNKEFPMLSVYKFPIALALSEHYRQNNLPIDYPIAILPVDLRPDTYSPMTEKILASSSMQTDTLMMSTTELLAYMLQQSDNNASDIVLHGLGGAEYVDGYLQRIGVKGVHVRNSEAEMHEDNSLCYANSASPVGMASLMDKFDNEFKDSISLEIKRLMETCETGVNRLPKPLVNTSAVIGHKTGTGFTLPDGKLMAVNDAGYVHLPNGHYYAIAVFIENSGYDMANAEDIISDISYIVFKMLSGNQTE
ncbi:MAG: class A beta-lactamase-related serine hydrolase [Muribaculum sp.]|nr:class A beta-lactamase-related serine hydrolase [Muribaculum sp.]